MKKVSFRPTCLLFALAAAIATYSCRPGKHYISSSFRQTYSDLNAVLHADTSRTPFFKAHFKNGEVSLLNDWSLNAAADSLDGTGILYDFNRNPIREGNLSFAIEDIAIIETNQLDAIRSKDGDRIASLSFLTGANLVGIVVCLSNPKACFGSCPTFYIEGQNDFHSAGAEGFSSSIAPAFEKRDVDALRYRTSAPVFSLSMKNEALETHMVNELLIHAAPKGRHENVLHDKNGKYYICGPLHSSKSARVDDTDIKAAVSAMDEHEYFSASDTFDLSAPESLIFEFDPIPGQPLGLAVNFRQTLVTTFLLYTGLSYMGDEVGDYFARVETNKQLAKRLADPFNRLGGIKMYVWNELAKKWHFFGELHETGPIAKNLMLAPLPERYLSSGTVKVKIEMARGLWRLDYVGLTAVHQEVQPYAVYPSTVEIVEGKNYSVDPLLRDDEDYVVAFPGDEYRFQFELPELSDNKEYELFLSSKGYYLEWIRPEWIKGKDPVKLRKWLLNDAQVWRELSETYKNMEQQMEAVFWDSKFSKTK